MKNDRKVIPFPTTVSEAEMNATLKKMYQEAATARSTDWVAFIEEIATEGRWYLKDAELFRICSLTGRSSMRQMIKGKRLTVVFLSK
ncbi:hypothetical protein OVA29_17410 [Exiguobacterium sp. SL14]|nr:hypothetical protein [Exiguobacterium sp. SL14]MCY1692148.1 hypothetical protein [Exiguobacterium sp. SL14]